MNPTNIKKKLDYQPTPHAKPNSKRDNWRFVWVMLFMLFPTLLLLSAIASILIWSGSGHAE